ncbi:hypothetical protein FEF65_12240 [Mariprofundus erugo]|uniref:Uncharacterized protein n=1 Tax=Mariprofundus erugo TaxID=2528639 RepID=A0A5R9GKN9_9PROT|nr:hypothetical protein [Mariprofundus erugo]TLS65735.1 hypothetical protein FEF65_12240 [Mariprofundus erugo]
MKRCRMKIGIDGRKKRNEAAKGQYRRLLEFNHGERMTRIARADVAGFIVNELLHPSFHRQTVNISY